MSKYKHLDGDVKKRDAAIQMYSCRLYDLKCDPFSIFTKSMTHFED